MKQKLMFLLVLLAGLLPATSTAQSEKADENRPYNYQDTIGAIYFSKDGSTVLYRSRSERGGLTLYLNAITQYIPLIAQGIEGYPEPEGGILLFTIDNEVKLYVGNAWLSDGNHTINISEKDYRHLTDLRRRSGTPASVMRWKRKMQHEDAEILAHEQRLDEWERQQAESINRSQALQPDERRADNYETDHHETDGQTIFFDDEPSPEPLAAIDNDISTVTTDTAGSTHSREHQVAGITARTTTGNPSNTPAIIATGEDTPVHIKADLARYWMAFCVLLVISYGIFRIKSARRN